MSNRWRLRCSNIPYRQGLIEVMGQVHPGLVNIETWQINVGTDVAGDLSDADLGANTELELTPTEARNLATALLLAADAADNGAER